MRKGSRFTGLSRGLNRTRGEMNKTEAEYAKHLDALIAASEVADYWFEPLSLRLSHPESGQPARFSPDFMVLMPDGTTYLDDVKGGMSDTASGVRLKCAAELFPLWKFRVAKKLRKKDGGGWKIQEV